MARHPMFVNWRWWLCLPVMLLMLPVGLILSLLQALGAWAESAEFYIRPEFRKLTRWANAAHKGEGNG